MEISKIYQEEQFLTKYFVIRHSKLLVIQSMMDINTNLDSDLQSFGKKARDIQPLSAHTGTEIEISGNKGWTNECSI